MSNIPQQPANPGPFKAQHGYVDSKFSTVTYDDKPTPFKESKASKFIHDENTKKYAKKGFGFIFNNAMRFVCN